MSPYPYGMKYLEFRRKPLHSQRKKLFWPICYFRDEMIGRAPQNSSNDLVFVASDSFPSAKVPNIIAFMNEREGWR
eukprot:CAMPEP_0201535038 /NCGR_PEP_ID=MMETSP0161_2-20130828/57889_1 /ASSEMBLY_ACC=CAM_ASM_000251 /TAXON_ID=180227 /ORGANISM="Neoparamoeba aestuarina, Strain SoJaBio B1-5/56/2" /LENGTH=75 /DNA_ID=CAMNT_0047939991 /DNA_START=367 /DNA_END=590 /DNA_ORIENTATION=+